MHMFMTIRFLFLYTSITLSQHNHHYFHFRMNLFQLFMTLYLNHALKTSKFFQVVQWKIISLSIIFFKYFHYRILLNHLLLILEL